MSDNLRLIDYEASDTVSHAHLGLPDITSGPSSDRPYEVHPVQNPANQEQAMATRENRFAPQGRTTMTESGVLVDIEPSRPSNNEWTEFHSGNKQEPSLRDNFTRFEPQPHDFRVLQKNVTNPHINHLGSSTYYAGKDQHEQNGKFANHNPRNEESLRPEEIGYDNADFNPGNLASSMSSGQDSSADFAYMRARMMYNAGYRPGYQPMPHWQTTQQGHMNQQPYGEREVHVSRVNDVWRPGNEPGSKPTPMPIDVQPIQEVTVDDEYRREQMASWEHPNPAPARPERYIGTLVLAIFALLCGNLCLGIAALTYADKARHCRDQVEARKQAGKSRQMSVLAILIGLIFGGIALALKFYTFRSREYELTTIRSIYG